MQVAVFDDSSSPEDPGAGLLGLAEVPLAALTQNLPIEGGFQLVNPSTGTAAGSVWLTVAWTNPLAPKQQQQVASAMQSPPQQQQQLTVPLYNPDRCMPPSAAAAEVGRQLLSRMEQQQGEPHVPLTAASSSSTQCVVPASVKRQQQQTPLQQQQQVPLQETPAAAGGGAAAGSVGTGQQMSYAKQQLQARWQATQASRQAKVPPPHEVTPIPGSLTAIRTTDAAVAAPNSSHGAFSSTQAPGRVLLFNGNQTPPAAAGIGPDNGSRGVHGVAKLSISSNVGTTSSSGAVAALGSSFSGSPAARQRYQQVEQSLEWPSTAAAAADAVVGDRERQPAPPLPLWHASRAAAAGFGGAVSLMAPDSRTAVGGTPAAAVASGIRAANAAAPSRATGAAAGDVDMVMQQVPFSAEAWGNYDSTIYFRIDGLHLSGEVLADEQVQCVLVAHSFMEDWTEVAQQCTRALPKR